MTVPNHPAPSLEVEQFIKDHAVTGLDVPQAQCPACFRTLVAVTLYTTGADRHVWAMRCPIHRTVFGVDAMT